MRTERALCHAWHTSAPAWLSADLRHRCEGGTWADAACAFTCASTRPSCRTRLRPRRRRWPRCGSTSTRTTPRVLRAPTSSSASTAIATAPIDPEHGVSGREQHYLVAGTRPRLVYVLPGAGSRDKHLGLLLSRIQADDLVSYRRVGGPPGARRPRRRRPRDGAHRGVHRRRRPDHGAPRRDRVGAAGSAGADPRAVAPPRRPAARDRRDLRRCSRTSGC